MKLTDIERLILINQFSIRKAVEKNDDYDHLIKILTDGYELFYGDLVSHLSAVPEDECRFVLDVLDMYRAIDDYKRANPKDMEVAELPWSSFPGFDGNNEAHLLGFAQFLIEDQEKFQEQRERKHETDGFNSHMPTVDIYRRMLAIWQGFGGRFKLTREQVVAILNRDRRPNLP